MELAAWVQSVLNEGQRTRVGVSPGRKLGNREAKPKGFLRRSEDGRDWSGYTPSRLMFGVTSLVATLHWHGPRIGGNSGS